MLTSKHRTTTYGDLIECAAAGLLAKIIAWVAFRPFMFGTVGGQSIIYVLRKGS